MKTSSAINCKCGKAGHSYYDRKARCFFSECMDCTRAKAKAYYWSNRERILARSQAKRDAVKAATTAMRTMELV